MPTGFDVLGYDHRLQNYWVKRVVAGIIDAVICSVISVVLLFFLGGFFMGFMFMGSGVIWWLYSSIMESQNGYTLGKKIMNMRTVVHVGAISLDQSLIRNVSKIFSILIIIDVIVGLATEGDPRQRYLDRVTNSLVIEEISLDRRPVEVPPAGESAPRDEDDYILPEE